MIEIAGEIAKANILLSSIENGAPKAINAALNRTIQGVRTDVVRKVTETYDIKSKQVRDGIKLNKSTVSSLRASVSGSGSAIPLINFRVTPNKPGQQKPGTVLRASVKKGGSKPIPGAFIMRCASGHVGVFRRMSKKRLPVDEAYGPSVPQMMNEESVRQTISESANERFANRLDHEVGRLLEKG